MCRELEHRDFRGLRFLHLHDHVAFREHVRGGGKNRCADLFISLVGKVDSGACLGLDKHLVTARDKFGDTRRGHADSIFVILDFFGNADAHR